MSRTLLILATHFIDENVISEYRKMKNTPNVDAVLMINNTECKFEIQSRVENRIFFGTSAKCFFFDQALHDELQLPYFTYFQDLFYKNFGNVLWNNCDYKIYYIKKFFPDYDYFWILEYDVFCNGETYEGFLKKFEDNRADLLINNFRIEENGGQWNWAQGLRWIYKQPKIYGTFFAAVRLSARAIDFLYQKRLEQKEIFQNSTDKNKRWTGCEAFVATELMNGGFSCENLNEPHLQYSPQIYLNDERIFLRPDNHLYHPVKSVRAEISKYQKQYDDLHFLYRKVFLTQVIEKLQSILNVRVKEFSIHYDTKFNGVMLAIPQKWGGGTNFSLRYDVRFMQGKIWVMLVFEGEYAKDFDVIKNCSGLEIFQPLSFSTNLNSKNLVYVAPTLDNVGLVADAMKTLIENTCEILLEKFL